MYEARGDLRSSISLSREDSNDEASAERFYFTREYGEFIGLAYTCDALNIRFEMERAQIEASGQTLIVADGDACYRINTPKGRAEIFLSSWHPIPGMPVVRTDAAAAEKYSDVFDLSDDWQYAPEVKNIVETWFREVVADDPASLASLTNQFITEGVYRAFLRSNRSPARFLSRSSVLSIKYFRVAWSLPKGIDLPEDVFPPVYEALGCICKNGDCTGRWPITAHDADASFWNDFPYICLHVMRDSPSADPRDISIIPAF
jgi:hypothetical protein